MRSRRSLSNRRLQNEWKPEKYRNHYVEAVRELIKEKAKGHVITTAEEPVPQRGTVINLMDALRKSVQGEGKQAPATATSKRAAPTTKKKTGTRR